MKKLPFKQVQVGYRTYKFILEDNTNSDILLDTEMGKCFKDEGEIYIASNYPNEEIANTVLHEILHACYHVYNIKDDDEEERTVTAMSNALCDAIVNNKELFKWINKTL